MDDDNIDIYDRIIIICAYTDTITSKERSKHIIIHNTRKLLKIINISYSHSCVFKDIINKYIIDSFSPKRLIKK